MAERTQVKRTHPPIFFSDFPVAENIAPQRRGGLWKWRRDKIHRTSMGKKANLRETRLSSRTRNIEHTLNERIREKKGIIESNNCNRHHARRRILHGNVLRGNLHGNHGMRNHHPKSCGLSSKHSGDYSAHKPAEEISTEKRRHSQS